MNILTPFIVIVVDMGRRQEQEQLQGLQSEKAYVNFINSLRSKATICILLIANIPSNISTLLNHDARTIEEQIISYLVHLRTNQKLSYSSLALRLAVLRRFYEMNDVVINWKKVSNYLGENIKLFKDRAYTTEEIQRLLTRADERIRVVILLLASTGMRIGAIPSLKLNHLTKVEDYNLYQITVYENTKDEYYCLGN